MGVTKKKAAANAADTAAPEWTVTLREIFQDAQIEAVEEAHYATKHKSSAAATSTGNDATDRDVVEQEIRERDERALLPALRRLQNLYRSEVGEGDDVAEEQWQVFLDELWLAMGRVMVAPKLHGVVVGTIAALIGLFLRDEADAKTPRERVQVATDAAATPQEAAKSTEEDAGIQELRTELLNRLMSATKADDKTIRLRACQMLQLILSKIRVIDDAMVARLRTTMVPRASDKVATVRIQSVMVLRRLQDGDDPTDEVTGELVRLMVSDPSKDVRKVAIENVAVTKVTYRDLFIRTRDVSDEVRTAAFIVLRDHMQFKDIPIGDRAQLLDQGLQDRSQDVRKACEGMLVDRWLADNNHSPSRLLKALDVEHCTDLCTKVSKLLLKHYTATNPFDRMLPSVDVAYVLSHRAGEGDSPDDLREALDGAKVFFWREQCIYFRDDNKDEEKLGILLPAISDYIKVLAIAGSCSVADTDDTEEAGKEPQDMMFVMQQLLALGHHLDFQDEYGRRVLLESLRKLLGDPAVDTQLIPSIMELMAAIYAIDNSQNDFVRVVAEILSDLYDPVDRQAKDEDDDDDKDGDIEPSQNSGPTEEELEAAAKRFEYLEKHIESLEYESEEYIAAQKEMEALEALLQDPKVLAWLRCLEILAQLLKLTNYNLKHPVISGVLRYILPSIESDIPAIRETGMECLGLYCLLDRHVAERYLVVFWRALLNDDEERDVKLNCIRSIMDMVFSFANLSPRDIPTPPKRDEERRVQDADEETEGREGDNSSAPKEPEPLKLETIFLGLAQLAATSHDDLDVQATIVEGFAKLFLMHRVRSPAVLSFLLETFFSPRLQKVQLLSEHGYHARALQLMSLFFPTFVKASTSNCTLFEEAAIHLVQKGIEKYEPSDAAREAIFQIDLVTVCKYIFHLLSHNDELTTDASHAMKKQDPEESQPKTSTSSVLQRCAHHNRVAINMCIDILAVEGLRKATNGPKIDSMELDSRQKLLIKMASLTDISAAEPRSAVLLLSLLKQVVNECFTSQKAIAKTLEALLKRLSATYALGRRQLGKTASSSEGVVDQDQEWATERIQERMQKIRAGIKECSVSRRYVRRSSANATNGRRGSGSTRRRASSSDSDSDEDNDDDNEDGSDEDDGDSEDGENSKKAKAPAARRASIRQSTAQAVDRMRTKNREFDVAMKMAFEDQEGEEDDEDEDGSGDEDDDSDDESDEDDQEEEDGA